jgi:hypothetical protein
MLELVFLLEALAGGVVISLGLIAELSSGPRAAPFRERFGALLKQYQAEDPTLSDPEPEMVPLRAMGLILNGAKAYERSALRDEDGPDKSFCALFLETSD